MIEENREILDKIDEIQKHFYNYLFTKTIRDISLSVRLKEKDWDFIKRLEGQKSLLFGRRNFKIEEIYLIIIPFTNFLKGVEKEVLPNFNIYNELNSRRLSLSPQEKSIRSILLENYENNIMSLGQMILDLYELAVVEDLKVHKNITPLCLSMEGIKNIEENLKFIEGYQHAQK